MTEFFDIYDDAFDHIGVKARDAVHRDGDWHKAFHCWVIYRDIAAQDWLIVQKRAPDKDTFPNLFDVSAAGHYTAGETRRDGVRELQEELGLTVAFDDLIPLGQRISIATGKTFVDRQIDEVFFYICDQALSDYHYQREEITGLIALNIREGIELFSGITDHLVVPAIGFPTEMMTVRLSDFVPSPDHYWMKILILAQRCLNGEKHLYI